MQLANQVNDLALWPTPTANDSKNSTFPPSLRGRDSLIGALFPTPSASGFECKDVDRLLERKEECKAKHKNGNGFGLTLGQYVAVWPTPTAMNATGGAALCKWGGSGARAKLRAAISPEELNGALNPTWVEWLQGFPLGWTEV
jgi:DNA (cytosine-5)-methyltransferase 1